MDLLFENTNLRADTNFSSKILKQKVCGKGICMFKNSPGIRKTAKKS